MPTDTDGPADERCESCHRLDPVNCPCPVERRYVVHVQATVAFAVMAESAEQAAYAAVVEPSLCDVIDTIDGPDVVHVVQED